MIDVMLLNFVALKHPDKPRRFEVPAEEGLTVRQIISAECIEQSPVELVLINGKMAGIDTAVKDGDRVALSAVITGG